MMKNKDLLNEIKELILEHNIDIEQLIQADYKNKKMSTKEAWQVVKEARHPKRLRVNQFIEKICDDFIELHGDRKYRDDPAIYGGIGIIHNSPVTIIGNQKGSNVEENIHRNFGMAHPEGYRKALRLMKQAEKFGRPIINIVDTPGAYCGIAAEERGQSEAIASNLFEMIDINVPILTIILGEGGSGGALALAVADEVWMFENSIYSVISPEGFSSILLKDASKANIAADMMKITPDDLLKFDLINKIINEPDQGIHTANESYFEDIKEDLNQWIHKMLSKDIEITINDRYERYRSFGVYKDNKSKVLAK